MWCGSGRDDSNQTVNAGLAGSPFPNHEGLLPAGGEVASAGFAEARTIARRYRGQLTLISPIVEAANGLGSLLVDLG